MPERSTTLLLPLRERGSAWAATLALLLYYAASAMRDLSLFDSGELALAAAQLGLGHPPGQPLHTLLGFVLSRLPLVSTHYGIVLASVVPGALTLLPATSFAQSLMPDDAPKLALRAAPWLLAICALHPALWETATRVEVYALATFFSVWAVARVTAQLAEPPSLTPAHVLSAGIALGLCASVNPMIALWTGVIVAPGIVLQVARKRLAARAIALAVAGGVLGLLPYAYVFAVASRTDVMIWGAPSDARALVHYFGMRDYEPNHALDWATYSQHVGARLAWGVTHWLVPLVALGCAGCIERGARTTLGRLAAPLLLVLLIASSSFNVVWHLDVPDFTAYLASAFWVLGAAAVAYAGQAMAQGRKQTAAVMAALLVLGALADAPRIFSRTRHRDHLVRALAEQVLREAPKGAIVITEIDHLAGALFYLQEAERARPDVVVLAYGLGSSSWHWQRIYRVHPELVKIALAGPGAKPGRVRRLLAANPERAVLVERTGLGAELGLRVCPGGVYLRSGAACDEPNPHAGALAKLLTPVLAELDDGSPGSVGAAALAAFDAGVAAWNAGDAYGAYVTLLSGVPPEARPHGANVSAAQLAHAPALRAPLPAFRRAPAIGDPARNLFVCALVLNSANLPAPALEHLRAAAALELPEALDLLQAAAK